MVKCSINKAACKRLAAELRGELELDLMEAFDPWALAELYGIEVIALNSLPVKAAVHQHFTVARPDVFSGALVPFDSGAVIIENDAPSLGSPALDDGPRDGSCRGRARLRHQPG